MRLLIACLTIEFAMSGSALMFAQVNPTDVRNVLQSSIAAQQGASLVQDGDIVGQVEFIIGGQDETGAFHFKATSSGATRTEISLSAENLTEIRSDSGNGGAGSWSAGDGQYHAIAGHNLLTDAAWFFPLLMLQRVVTDPNRSITFVGVEGGLAHFQTNSSAGPDSPPHAASDIQHWSQEDIFLDFATLLPVRITFSTHPDKNALIDMPVVVEFSDYETVNGVKIPLHVKKLVNGSLQMDLHVQNASFNTGLPSSDFVIN